MMIKHKHQNKEYSYSLHIWKQRSLLVSTFLISITAYMIIAFCYFSFSNTLQSEEEKQQQILHAETYIQGIMDNTLSLFEGVSQSITQFGMNKNIYSLMFTERLSDSPANAVMLQLSGIVNEYPLIQEMAVYFKKTDRVVTSSYLVSTLSVSKYADIINAYFNKEVATSDLEFHGRTGHLFTYDKKLVLARTLPFDNENSLATAFCIINTETLFQSTIKKHTIYVFDRNRNAIFLDEIPYPSESYEYYNNITSGKSSFLQDKTNTVYYASSEDTGWTYLYFVDSGEFLQTFQSTWRKSTYYFILFLFPLIFILSLIVTYILTRPYYLILQEVSEEDRKQLPSPTNFSNEASYIGGVMQQLFHNTSLLKTAIKDVSYDVTSRLFKDILMGEQLDYVSTEKILENAGSSFSLNAPYFVCVLQKENQPLNLQERKTFMHAFNKAIQNLQSKSDILFHSMTVDTDIVIICSFPHKTSPLIIARSRDELKILFQELNLKTGLNILSENGRVYYSILDLVFSYHDAKASLQSKSCRQTIHMENPEEREDWENEEETAVTSKVSDPEKLILISIASNIGKILDYIANQEPEAAATLYQRLIDDIITTSNKSETIKNLCENIISQLTNQLIKHPTFGHLPIPENLIFISAEFIKNSTDSSVLIQQMKHQGTSLISQLTEVIRKEQNHYLQATKEYIMQNYHDSSLSLTSLSRIIKVNDSYLSKLFKANLGINFVDYLNNYRILQSKKMLTETDLPIKDIAESTGFNSVQNYIRVFKKYTDMTPGQFRIAQRQLSEKNTSQKEISK